MVEPGGRPPRRMQPSGVRQPLTWCLQRGADGLRQPGRVEDLAAEATAMGDDADPGRMPAGGLFQAVGSMAECGVIKPTTQIGRALGIRANN